MSVSSSILGGNWPTWFAHLAAWPDRLHPCMAEVLPISESGRGLNAGSNRPTHPMKSECTYHTPVMADEVVHFLQPAAKKLFLDCTLGGGGHSERLVQAGASVLALDQDPDAIQYTRQRLSDCEDRIAFIQMNFRHYPDLLREVGVERELDGILLDLGVSSWQIDTPERGFSFSQDGPLDMRMDPSSETTAAEIIATADEEELRRIFREYGEEQQAARIAAAIVRRRRNTRIDRTGPLATLIEEVCGRRGPKHPATRVFQALRIAVNDEMGALSAALEQAPQWLKPGGRLVVLTFHSLEDRMVKQFLQRQSKPTIDRPEWPAPRPNPDCHFKLVVRKALVPGDEEISRNSRARSAKLRVAERLAHHEEASQKIAQ